MPAVVDPEGCTGCETCVSACPAAAITMEDGMAKVDADLCVDCVADALAEHAAGTLKPLSLA